MRTRGRVPLAEARRRGEERSKQGRRLRRDIMCRGSKKGVSVETHARMHEQGGKYRRAVLK